MWARNTAIAFSEQTVDIPSMFFDKFIVTVNQGCSNLIETGRPSAPPQNPHNGEK